MSRAILLFPLCVCISCYCDTFVFHHTKKPYTTSVYYITRANHSYSSVISEVYMTVHMFINVFSDMKPCCLVKRF